MASRSLQFALLVIGVMLITATTALAAPLSPAAGLVDTGCAYVVTRGGQDDAALVVLLEGPAGLTVSVHVARPAHTHEVSAQIDPDACIRAAAGPACGEWVACCEREPDLCAPMASADPLYLEREYGHDLGPVSFCVYLRIDDRGIDSDADITRSCYAPPPPPGGEPGPTRT